MIINIPDEFSPAKHLKGGVYFVQQLPRTVTGKVQRHLVQKMAIDMYNERNANRKEQWKKYI